MNARRTTFCIGFAAVVAVVLYFSATLNIFAVRRAHMFSCDGADRNASEGDNSPLFSFCLSDFTSDEFWANVSGFETFPVFLGSRLHMTPNVFFFYSDV